MKFFHFFSTSPLHPKGALTINTSFHHPRMGRIWKATSKLTKYLSSFPRPTLYKAALELKSRQVINSCFMSNFCFSVRPEPLRCNIRLPELSEGGEEGRDWLKNNKRTIESVEDYLKCGELYHHILKFESPSRQHHWCCRQHKQQSLSCQRKKNLQSSGKLMLSKMDVFF